MSLGDRWYALNEPANLSNHPLPTEYCKRQRGAEGMRHSRCSHSHHDYRQGQCLCELVVFQGLVGRCENPSATDDQGLEPIYLFVKPFRERV